MAGATPPSAAHLPLEAEPPFPVDALKEAAQRRAGSLNPYQTTSDGFDVAFITPVLTYGAQYHADQMRRQDHQCRHAHRRSLADQLRPIMDFANWSEYMWEFPPVLLIRATPKLAEGFWTKVGRMAARTQGMALPPFKRYKSGFGRMTVFCGDKEVTPIHPFRLERRVSERDSIFEGLYVVDPGALGPHCASVKLVLYSEKDPDRAERASSIRRSSSSSGTTSRRIGITDGTVIPSPPSPTCRAGTRQGGKDDSETCARCDQPRGGSAPARRDGRGPDGPLRRHVDPQSRKKQVQPGPSPKEHNHPHRGRREGLQGLGQDRTCLRPRPAVVIHHQPGRQGVAGQRRQRNADSVTVKRIDANTLETVARKGGKVTTTQRNVVSADGKTRTVTTTGTNARGAEGEQRRGVRQKVAPREGLTQVSDPRPVDFSTTVLRARGFAVSGGGTNDGSTGLFWADSVVDALKEITPAAARSMR